MSKISMSLLKPPLLEMLWGKAWEATMEKSILEVKNLGMGDVSRPQSKAKI